METQLITEELHDLVDPNRESCCLHSLGNKCKEWANLQDFYLISGNRFCGINEPLEIIKKEAYWEHSFIADTESEAIFKACEWVMEQQK